jgi:predicted nuclease of predicted toxin-antitoxin system
MRLLLDECVAHDLRQDLAGHVVTTVVEAGYTGLRNGELLRTAAGQYDVLITVDRNLPHQQNIHSLGIAVIIIEGVGITYPHLKQLAASILETLKTIRPGQMVKVSKN